MRAPVNRANFSASVNEFGNLNGRNRTFSIFYNLKKSSFFRSSARRRKGRGCDDN
jgi:hypothetical protein